MAQYRLNARKPKNNAGLPTAKRGELYLIHKDDVASMPTIDPKGIICDGDIHLKSGRRVHILYLTPSTQKRNINSEGDPDSRGFKKKVVGNFPGDDVEVHQFIKNNINEAFLVIMNSYDSTYQRLYGSKDNPLYFNGEFKDDSDGKGYELTFEQNFADDTPLLFYNGEILIDESALEEEDIEFDTKYVRLDGSNLSEANQQLWKEMFKEEFLTADFFPISNQW